VTQAVGGKGSWGSERNSSCGMLTLTFPGVCESTPGGTATAIAPFE